MRERKLAKTAKFHGDALNLSEDNAKSFRAPRFDSPGVEVERLRCCRARVKVLGTRLIFEKLTDYFAELRKMTDVRLKLLYLGQLSSQLYRKHLLCECPVLHVYNENTDSPSFLLT